MSEATPARTVAPAKSNPWLVFVLLGAMFVLFTAALLVPGVWDGLVSTPASNTRGGRLLAAIESLGYGPTVAIMGAIAVASIVGGLIARRRGRPGR
jgi:hypothetical protein